MLHAISWSSFLIAVLCLAIIYWLIVILIYYSGELKGVASGKIPGREKAGKISPNSVFAHDSSGLDGDIHLDENSDRDLLFQPAYRLVDELKEIITSCSEKNSPKVELAYAIKMALNKPEYAGLKESSFKESINNLIEGESAAKGKISFSKEETDILWR
jgi:hypothetical protein